MQITTANIQPITADAVSKMEVELLKMPQADIVTRHLFKPGIYEREITIPPWTILTGAVHKTPYKVRLVKGTIAVNTDDGIRVLIAPFEIEAPAGVKRIGRVFDQEVVWVDVYDNADNCRDIVELENRLYEVPECGLGDNRVARKIAQDRADYLRFIEQLGLTQAEMDKIVATDDLMPMPEGMPVEVRDSRLHGKGLFCLHRISPGQVICPGRIGDRRTPAGRFINHSATPNAEPVMIEGDIYAVAIRPIQENEEIFVDYRESMRVNCALSVGEN